MSGAMLISHGCRLNIAESEKIAGMLAGEDDLVVVNSCAVTAEAVKSARQAIRRAKRERPEARVVVTGCAAQTEPETFRAMAEVSAVVPNMGKLEASLYLFPGEGRGQDVTELRAGTGKPELASRWTPAFAAVTAWGKSPEVPASAGTTSKGHARTFLPVQNGCDHRCTFCIIPYGRGPSRSLPAGGVIEEVRAAVEGGAREVVLTGVDLTAYGADLPGQPSLGSLVERILRHVPDLPRLRLSSLDPCEVDERLLDLIAHDKRMMPHVHLSLQAGDDMILKRMKRRHSRAQAVALVAKLKTLRPGLAIGADLIAGFPTEDEAMFANTLALIDDCTIAFAHVFPYSPRAGTPAARMPQLSRETIKDRAARLRHKAEQAKAAWLREQIGIVTDVLVELDGVSGHAENFARVVLGPSPSCTPSALVGEGVGEAASMAASTIDDIAPSRAPSPQPSAARSQGRSCSQHDLRDAGGIPHPASELHSHKGRGAFVPNSIVRTRISGVAGDTLLGTPA